MEPVKKSLPIDKNPESKQQPKVEVKALEARVAMLEEALSKFATLSGHANYLREYGLKAWVPGKKDMTKYG